MKKETSQNPGKVLDFQQVPGGLLLNTQASKLRVLFYQDHVVRITFSRTGDFDDFSYAVNTSPAKVTFDVLDTPDKIFLTGPNFRVNIYKSDASIRIESIDGIIINEDEKGLPTSWIGEQVTTYKKLQEGERFIGLGEKTGPLDRKGASYQNWTRCIAQHLFTSAYITKRSTGFFLTIAIRLFSISALRTIASQASLPMRVK